MVETPPKPRGARPPVPQPLPPWSPHPGCLGEGAQEGEVAASASDICDGGRVSRPLMEGATRQDLHLVPALPGEGAVLYGPRGRGGLRQKCGKVRRAFPAAFVSLLCMLSVTRPLCPS